MVGTRWKNRKNGAIVEVYAISNRNEGDTNDGTYVYYESKNVSDHCLFDVFYAYWELLPNGLERAVERVYAFRDI